MARSLVLALPLLERWSRCAVSMGGLVWLAERSFFSAGTRLAFSLPPFGEEPAEERGELVLFVTQFARKSFIGPLRCPVVHLEHCRSAHEFSLGWGMVVGSVCALVSGK
jgi:hypothetical protein